jgi:hypothetical protein
MPGRSRSKNGVASLAYVAGHPRLYGIEAKDVDGRNKSGHDEAGCGKPALPIVHRRATSGLETG